MDIDKLAFEEFVKLTGGKPKKKMKKPNLNSNPKRGWNKAMWEKWNTHLVCNFDTTTFSSKPTGAAVGGVQNRLNNNIKRINVEDFAKDVALNGYSFKAAQIKGSKNEDWIGQELFALDIDNKYKKGDKKYPYLSMEEAYNRCVRYNIKPLFMYPSFSSTPELNKFRIVFRVPTIVKDLRIRNVIYNALFEIFPERDKACSDHTRIFFGGCQELYKFNKNALLDPVDLIQSMVTYIKNIDNKNAARKIKNFCNVTGLNVLNNLPYVIKGKNKENKENKENLIEYITCITPTYFNFNITENDLVNLKDNTKTKKYKNIIYKKDFKEELIRNFNFVELESKCKLWNEFISGKRWCYHDEVFGMATNMWRVQGAEKKMIKAINNNPNYKDSFNKINTIKSMRKYGYEPIKCIKFCPYYSSCNTNCNMLTVVNNKRNNIRKIEESKAITLKEAEEKLLSAMEEAIKGKNNDIYVIKAPTGIGKTKALEDIAKNFGLLNTCIAYPNHKLGKEIIERIKVPEYIYLKDLNIKNKAFKEEYIRLQSIGAYKIANQKLDKYLNQLMIDRQKLDKKSFEYLRLQKEIDTIGRYICNKKDAKTTNLPIFCTHAKALTLKNNNIDTYIFDEDVFLSSAFKTINLSQDNLQKAINAAKVLGTNNTTYKQLVHLKTLVEEVAEFEGRVIKNDIVKIDEKEINEIINLNKNLDINIIDLLKVRILTANAKGEVMGAYMQELPNKKCIILSATANQKVYNAAFKNRKVKFIDLGEVKTKGKLILHYNSFSRAALIAKEEKLINMIKEEAPNIKNIITFNMFKNKFKEVGFNPIAHFGACTGLDTYKGQDLIVAGTPHVDNRIYTLLATLINPEITIVKNLEFTNIIKNGYEFSLMTYGDTNGDNTELLREIQSYLIESELIQAVGRARILREDATVHLFSNYPLQGCNLYTNTNNNTNLVA